CRLRAARVVTVEAVLVDKGTIGFRIRCHQPGAARQPSFKRRGNWLGRCLREQTGRAGTGNGSSGNELLHRVSGSFFSGSVFFCPSGSGGGTGAGSLGPRRISSRTTAMTSSRESRRGFQVRESVLFPGGGGGSGFSASRSGVRLSLLTASSLAPAATRARIISTRRAVTA